MGLVNQTLILLAGITFFSWLPVFSTTVKKHSRIFFYTGVGATIGICFLDLFPDILETGGKAGLIVVAVTLFLYSLLHGRHDHAHDHQKPLLFYVSLATHSFASGMLLSISFEVSLKTANLVFLALMIHKAYEALMFSFVLVDSCCSKTKRFWLLSAYGLSLPLGVLVTSFFKDSMGPGVPMVISSIAVGTLLGCLIYDFLFPSLRQLKARRFEVSWMVLGLVISQLVLKGFVGWLH